MYLGDAAHLRTLLPHPSAAIFIADYNGDYNKLAEYLTYLSTNETAYEVHREWRKTFTHEGHIKNKPLLQSSWYCDVCRWAADNAGKISRHKADELCRIDEMLKTFSSTIGNFEGQAIRARGDHSMYLVEKGTLRLIPDSDTLESLHLVFDGTLWVSDAEVKKCVKGEAVTPIGISPQAAAPPKRQLQTA